jgi:uncharacterized protein
MTRLLLVIAVVVFVLWLMRRGGARRASRKPPAAPQTMVQCAHCGVHLPRGEALLLGDQAFCSPAHRDAGARKG